MVLKWLPCSPVIGEVLWFSYIVTVHCMYDRNPSYGLKLIGMSRSYTVDVDGLCI